MSVVHGGLTAMAVARASPRSGPRHWGLLPWFAVMLAGCATAQPTAEGSTGPEGGFDVLFPRVTCGGRPGFDPRLLDEPGGAERGDDAAAAALRQALVPVEGERDVLPDSGWVAVTRSEEMVKYLAHGGAGPGLAIVTVERRGDEWTRAGSGRCDLRPEVREGFDLATFRVAPAEPLTMETTEVDVLVMEMGCSAGEDARGRIVDPVILPSAAAVTVVFATIPRDGDRDCVHSGTLETPFLLKLPEALGDRMLLDGSEIPPRDATQCHARVC